MARNANDSAGLSGYNMYKYRNQTEQVTQGKEEEDE